MNKDEAIKRFIQRGKAGGHISGFRPGGIIDTGGREKMLAEMHDKMVEVAQTNPNIIKIDPTLGDVDGTYNEILRNIG